MSAKVEARHRGAAARFLGPCTCGKEYQGRKMIAPDCAPCQDDGDTAQALFDAEAAGMERANERAVGIVEYSVGDPTTREKTIARIRDPEFGQHTNEAPGFGAISKPGES